MYKIQKFKINYIHQTPQNKNKTITLAMTTSTLKQFKSQELEEAKPVNRQDLHYTHRDQTSKQARPTLHTHTDAHTHDCKHTHTQATFHSKYIATEQARSCSTLASESEYSCSASPTMRQPPACIRVQKYCLCTLKIL